MKMSLLQVVFLVVKPKPVCPKVNQFELLSVINQKQTLIHFHEKILIFFSFSPSNGNSLLCSFS